MKAQEGSLLFRNKENYKNEKSGTKHTALFISFIVI
jgi:hypothetical protein